MEPQQTSVAEAQQTSVAEPQQPPRAGLSNRWHVVLGLVLPSALFVFHMAEVWGYTVDDAYISFRYARNLAKGLGLVYNPGEHIEGYTNFLWTVLLAFGFKLHLDPEVVSKILGGLASLGALCAVYTLSARLRSFAFVPCLATWFMATSIVQSGYAVFGLETSLFTCLVLWGVILFLNEQQREGGFPFSGLVFAVAGLTRPEAPMYLGIPMLFLGWRFFGRQNIVRGLSFSVIVGAHAIWRHAYYGSWLPNTLTAKTGDLAQQLNGGERYLYQYAYHAWPVLLLACLGFGLFLVNRHKSLGLRGWMSASGPSDATARIIIALGAASVGYVLIVGGDWMPYFRFFAVFEPFCFVLACAGTRRVLDPLVASATSAGSPHRRWRPAIAALMLVLVGGLGAFRVSRLNDAQAVIMSFIKPFWERSAGRTATWLVLERQPGEIAVADIGYIGYATDYPILDLLGLVDPVISKLPGGYTQKTGAGYVERVFDKSPDYFVFVGKGNTCDPLRFPAQERLRRDERFQRGYRLATSIRHSNLGVWCIFERTHPKDRTPAGL